MFWICDRYQSAAITAVYFRTAQLVHQWTQSNPVHILYVLTMSLVPSLLPLNLHAFECSGSTSLNPIKSSSHTVRTDYATGTQSAAIESVCLQMLRKYIGEPNQIEFTYCTYWLCDWYQVCCHWICIKSTSQLYVLNSTKVHRWTRTNRVRILYVLSMWMISSLSPLNLYTFEVLASLLQLELYTFEMLSRYIG